MNTEKQKKYDLIYSYLKEAIESNQKLHIITLYSECINLLSMYFETMDWVGFYFVEKDYLYLGPYLPGFDACEEIPMGKGVCGTCLETKLPQLVSDVSCLHNYIACSSKTQSEVVVPVFQNGAVVSVLDIDSDAKAAFDETDLRNLVKICNLLSDFLSRG